MVLSILLQTPVDLARVKTGRVTSLKKKIRSERHGRECLPTGSGGLQTTTGRRVRTYFIAAAYTPTFWPTDTINTRVSNTARILRAFRIFICRFLFRYAHV